MKAPLLVGGVDPQLEQAGWYLGAVQSVFLQKHHLETADTSTSSVRRLYDAPWLIGFGQDAVDNWFTENEVSEIVAFANRLEV